MLQFLRSMGSNILHYPTLDRKYLAEDYVCALLDLPWALPDSAGKDRLTRLRLAMM